MARVTDFSDGARKRRERERKRYASEKARGQIRNRSAAFRPEDAAGVTVEDEAERVREWKEAVAAGDVGDLLDRRLRQWLGEMG